jgi:RHS repeat-associated protein
VNAAFQTALPEHLPLAASPQLAENSRLGFQPVASTSRWGFSFAISSNTLGLSGSLYDGRVRSRSTGKERDAESGNDYFGARYYASSMGRMLSPDYADDDDGPVSIPNYNPSNPQSLNLYSYVHNNPLTNTDPDGHDVNVCTTDSSGSQHCTQMTNDQYKAAQQAGNGGLNVPTLDQVGMNGNGSGQFNSTAITDANGNTVGTATYVSDGPTDYYANRNGLNVLGTASATVGSVKGVAAFYGASALGAAGAYAAGLTAGADLTTLGSLAGETVHSEEAALLARHGITPEQARDAIEAAKKAGNVVEAMGRYGPQLRYTANGIRVVVATTGRNAGKIITAFFK